jgi:ATP-dependent DNA helicase RecQ
VIKVSSVDEKMIWLAKNIEKFPGSGILYTGTRVGTEIYSKWFEFMNISSTAYNAGFDAETRVDIERGLMENRWKCIISTNALGMGFDKPDIRFVFHTQIPQSPVHYYQEIGRAGRDGETSYIILLYNQNEDSDLPKAFIEGARPTIQKYHSLIEYIKTGMYGRNEIIRKLNLKTNQFDVIKADLMEKGIMREVIYGKLKKYEYIPGAPTLTTSDFEALRNAKLADLDKMIGYVETKESRMRYLCDYLGDETAAIYKNCDNTGEKKLTVLTTPELLQKLADFRASCYPRLEVVTTKTNLINGVASSYYGVSHVGQTLHRCKYETHEEFPDFLLRLTLKAFYRTFEDIKFDMILYVPPTKSGNLVRNFAEKLSSSLKIPISHGLLKTKLTEEQKIFESGICKQNNVKDAFKYADQTDIRGKKVLL